MTDDVSSPTAPDLLAQVSVGDEFAWMGAILTVTRVAKSGAWADVEAKQPNGATWKKRQPLPFPADCVRLNEPDVNDGEDYARRCSS